MATNLLATRTLTVIFIIALFALGVFLLKSIVISLLLGLLAAYIFYPVYKKLDSKLKSPRISAIILIIGMVLVLVIPLFYLIPIIIKQSFDFYSQLQNINLSQYIMNLLPESVEESRFISVNLNNILAQGLSTFLNQVGIFLVNVPKFLLQFLIFLFTFYFSIVDSEKLKKYFLSLSPFPSSTERKFLEEFRKITDSIIYGQFFIGVIQGLILGLGLLLLGVPHVTILTMLAIIFSIIPVVGSWFVWIPIALYLFTIGSPIKAIILILYGGLFVGTLDNFLRPYFLSKTAQLPVSVGVIGIIAGLYAFGIAGIILGPLILAYILIVLDFYREGKLSELFKKGD